MTCWVEKQGVGAAPGAGCGPGSILPESMLLLLPVLKCGCVKGAGGVGRTISTELWRNLSPRGLVLGLAGAGGGVAPGRRAISCWWPPDASFCDDLAMAMYFWMAPQPIGSCEAVAAYV